MWFPHGKLVNESVKLDTLNDYRKKEIAGIFKELKIEAKGEEIAKDVIKILTSKLPEQTLLTIMIREQEKAKFVGEIKDYVEFFSRGTLEKEVSVEGICSICNKQSLVSEYKESPLPFFFRDKKHFFDNAKVTKGFALCESCYIVLQKGTKFIKDNLDYHISSGTITK